MFHLWQLLLMQPLEFLNLNPQPPDLQQNPQGMSTKRTIKFCNYRNAICQPATYKCTTYELYKKKNIHIEKEYELWNKIKQKWHKSTNLCNGVPRRALREIIVYLCHCTLDHVHHLPLWWKTQKIVKFIIKKNNYLGTVWLTVVQQ